MRNGSLYGNNQKIFLAIGLTKDFLLTVKKCYQSQIYLGYFWIGFNMHFSFLSFKFSRRECKVLTRQLPCEISYAYQEVIMGRTEQLRKGAILWNSLLAKNLANQAKVILAVVMLTGVPCLGDQGKCHKIWGKKWEFLHRKRKRQENYVFSVALTCNVEGAANILDRPRTCSWQLQPVCLVWQMQMVSNSTKCLEDVRHFQWKLNSMMSMADEIGELDWTFEII